MWYFKAKYYDIENDKEITRRISFDGQFFDNEKECYIYAMTKAYDLMEKWETLLTLEFIAC